MPQPAEWEVPLRYHKKNAEHLAQSGPLYPADFFEPAYWQKRLSASLEEFQQDKSARLYIYLRTGDGDEFVDDIIGSANLSDILRRAAQFCYLGYGLAADAQGHGYMSEAIERVVRFGFEELNLHRIMANYMPSNKRSGNVLKSVGFVEEGIARDYLYLKGSWQDHVLTSITNAHWRPDRA
jgi:ribosomal-protein-alanine N-acetyltransferase